MGTIIFQLNLKYKHSLLTILHHQLKVNKKFNMNFNLNRKYDRVRENQKTLNFNITIPLVTYCFSSTPSTLSALDSCPHSPASPSLWLLSSSLLLEILKNWKEKWAIICIANICFLRFQNEKNK